MSLYESFIKDTRFLLIASASGIALLSQQLPSHALDSPFSKLKGAPTQQQAEPGHLQVTNAQVRSISPIPSSSAYEGQAMQTQFQQPASADDRVKNLYGAKAPAAPQAIRPATPKPLQQRQPTPVQQQSQQAAQPQQQPKVAQTAGTRMGRRSLFDRLVGKVKGDSKIPSGPPQDPGMRYTTVSQAAQQNQKVAQQEPNRFIPPAVPGVDLPAALDTAQSAGKFVPPLVPDIVTSEPVQTVLTSTPKAETAKPRLFPTSKDANPIEHPLAMPKRPPLVPPAAPPAGFLPPAPDADGFLAPALPQQSVAKADSSQEKLQSFPELKAILEGNDSEAPKVAATPVPAPPSTLDSPEWKKTASRKESGAVTTVIVPKPDTFGSLGYGKKLPNLELQLKAASAAQKSQALTRNVVEVPPINDFEIPAPEDLQAPMLASAPVPAVTQPEVTVEIDPLANPFPEDVEEIAESKGEPIDLVIDQPAVKESKTEEPVSAPKADVATLTAPAFPTNDKVMKPEQKQEVEAPYTGLALEENLFLTTQTPAPAEPQAEEISEDSSIASKEIATAQADSLPQLPLLPLPEPEEKQESEVTKTPSPVIPQVAEAEAPEEEPGRTGLARPDLAPQLQAPKVTLKEASPPKKEESRQTKMELISSRKELTGLKGFCSVSLRDSRDLVNVEDKFTALFNGKEYSFSSAEALDKFTADPGKYAPAIRGSDVIHLSLTGEEVEGSLDHAVWYKGRLYLFTTVETMETFVAAPSSHATDL